MSQTIVDTADGRSTRNGERETVPERRGSECPECAGSIHHDEERGEHREEAAARDALDPRN
jgi:transcription initiation factor TFIIB